MSGEGTVEQVLASEARWSLAADDFRALLATLPDSCLDSCVCDPPYELGFMGRKWDASGIAYDVDGWREVLRVLKPGAHLLAFGGTRTYHRMACAIEDAGFEIRDSIAWLYASGFPKSLNVSKAIDAAAGAEREVVGIAAGAATSRTESLGVFRSEYEATAPATDAAKQWDGWGTALKPAMEPIVVARKPLGGTVAANVLEHGTGALNVDGCRVPGEYETRAGDVPGSTSLFFGNTCGGGAFIPTEGRWPANVIHDGSDEVLDAFARYGERDSGVAVMRNGGGCKIWGDENRAGARPDEGYFDSGTAARFYFCAKASRAERELGCEGLGVSRREDVTGRKEGSAGQNHARSGMRRTGDIRNVHPTVKPLALMRYLCRLVTPPGGVVLDPYTGSGTCGMAALLEGFRYLGAEAEVSHVPIARARIGHPLRVETEESPTPTGASQMGLFGKVGT